MKKFLFLVMAALLLGTTVTGCKGKSQADKTNDSIAEIMGKIEGTQMKSRFQQNPEMLEQLDKDQFLKGMMTVINMDTTKNSKSYLSGLQAGMQIYQQLAQLEAQGIKIDRKVFLNEFKKIVESKDSLNIEKMDAEMQNLQGQLNSMKDRAMKVIGQENLVAGKKYVEDLMKKDSGYKKDKSGVIYKIEEPGKGESFTDTTVVDTKMLCKDMNGVVLVNMGTPQPLPLAQIKSHPIFGKLYDLIKGMKPGAKLVAVIPGDQIPAEMMGLSPNMTLVCELTTVGVHKEEPRPAPQGYPGRPAPAKGAQPAQPAPAQSK